MNMVTAEVTDFQQVTTRSKGKAAECDTQENIQKQSTEWIKKVNERNMAEKRETKRIAGGARKEYGG